MTELPLFPLSAVLVPYGRMPLQIFERRYLDLVRDSLRDATPFGIVWLRSGQEVASPDAPPPELAAVGTTARIVDWDQLPNGLLGVTVEGGERFDLNSAQTNDDGLIIGKVLSRPDPEPEAMTDEWDPLLDVLRSLQTHPHVQRLHLSPDYDNAWEVGYQLVQLLPLEESVKFDLLCVDEVTELMDELDVILHQLSGSD